MTLRDLLKKKDKVNQSQISEGSSTTVAPAFTLIRSDTHSQEVLAESSFPSAAIESATTAEKAIPEKHSSRFRSLSSASTAARDLKGERRLSQLLNLRSHSHDSRTSSINIPIDLPKIDDSTGGREESEAQWEKRATILAKENPNLRSSTPPEGIPVAALGELLVSEARSNGPPQIGKRYISDAKGDVR